MGDVYNYGWTGSQWVPDSKSSGGSSAVAGTATNPSSLPSDATAGQKVDLIADLKGRLMTYLGTALDSTNDSVGAVPKASATVGGCDTYFNAALTNTVVSVKASAGNVYQALSYNSGAAYAFIQVFDVASGSVTLGTTTPKYVFPVPNAGVYDTPIPMPITHSTAISIAATSTATGNVAPAATQTMWLGYK